MYGYIDFYSNLSQYIVFQACIWFACVFTQLHIAIYGLTARSAAAGDMPWEALSQDFEPLGNSIAMAIALG